MLVVITHPLAGLGGVNTGHTIKHPGPRPGLGSPVMHSVHTPRLLLCSRMVSAAGWGWTTNPETFKVLMGLQVNMYILKMFRRLMFAHLGLVQPCPFGTVSFFRIYCEMFKIRPGNWLFLTPCGTNDMYITNGIVRVSGGWHVIMSCPCVTCHGVSCLAPRQYSNPSQITPRCYKLYLEATLQSISRAKMLEISQWNFILLGVIENLWMRVTQMRCGH